MAFSGREGLEQLRDPMAAYRKQLYSVLAARYRQQAATVGSSVERLASR